MFYFLVSLVVAGFINLPGPIVLVLYDVTGLPFVWYKLLNLPPSLSVSTLASDR